MQNTLEIFEEEVKKELTLGEFRNAHTHSLKRRYAEYYSTQKRKWQSNPSLSIGHNPIEKFKDILSVFTISLFPEYIIVGPAEKEGIRHAYTEIVLSLLSYVNRNLIHPYLLDLLDRGNYPFYDNHIVVEVIDSRGAEPVSNRVLLKGVFTESPFTPSLLSATKATETEEAVAIARTAKVCLDPIPDVFEVLKRQDYNEKKLDQVKVDPPQKRKAQIKGIITEYRRMRERQKKEVFPGLERLTSTHIYRTTKFVGGSRHYSINAVASADYIEVVFRQGEKINTAENGFISRRKFFSPAQIDTYIESTKKLLEIYHVDLKCICDISSTPRKIKPFTYSPQQRPEDPSRRITRINPSPRIRQYQPRYSERQSDRQEDLAEFNFDYTTKKFM